MNFFVVVEINVSVEWDHVIFVSLYKIKILQHDFISNPFIKLKFAFTCITTQISITFQIHTQMPTFYASFHAIFVPRWISIPIAKSESVNKFKHLTTFDAADTFENLIASESYFSFSFLIMKLYSNNNDRFDFILMDKRIRMCVKLFLITYICSTYFKIVCDDIIYTCITLNRWVNKKLLALNSDKSRFHHEYVSS